jgi:hypothetical protein
MFMDSPDQVGRHGTMRLGTQITMRKLTSLQTDDMQQESIEVGMLGYGDQHIDDRRLTKFSPGGHVEIHH